MVRPSAAAAAPLPRPPAPQVPDALLPDEVVEALVAERRPRFVPLDGGASTSAGGGAGAAPGHGGVVQLRLSNGIRVNYRRTDNEPRGAMLRLVAAGGRATEGQGAGPLGTGVMALGTRTLSEAGTVGGWNREQVELFCISKLINCVLETDEEFVCMDFHFAVRRREEGEGGGGGGRRRVGGARMGGIERARGHARGRALPRLPGLAPRTQGPALRARFAHARASLTRRPRPPVPAPLPSRQVSDGGVASVLQLLHLFLEQPRWEAAAMERSKQQYLSHYRSLSKSLERATADRILQARRRRRQQLNAYHFFRCFCGHLAGGAAAGGRPPLAPARGLGWRARCARLPLHLSDIPALLPACCPPTPCRGEQAMLGPDRRFRDPNPEEIAALDLESMRLAVMRQIHAGNVEVGASGGGWAAGWLGGRGGRAPLTSRRARAAGERLVGGWGDSMFRHCPRASAAADALPASPSLPRRPPTLPAGVCGWRH